MCCWDKRGREIRNPNIEMRNKFKIRKRKAQNIVCRAFRSFEFWISDLFRISDFEFRNFIPGVFTQAFPDRRGPGIGRILALLPSWSIYCWPRSRPRPPAL